MPSRLWDVLLSEENAQPQLMANMVLPWGTSLAWARAEAASRFSKAKAVRPHDPTDRAAWHYLGKVPA